MVQICQYHSECDRESIKCVHLHTDGGVFESVPVCGEHAEADEVV